MPAYRLEFGDSATHHLDVTLRVAASRGASGAAGEILLWLPTWTPGSYLIREFGRHLRGIRARSGGRDLAVERIDKTSFRILGAGDGDVDIAYRVYANELTVRTSYVDERFAMVNGASVFLAVAGAEGEPCDLAVDLPAGWQAYTGLPRSGGDGAVYRAGDYDELVDCPLVLGSALRAVEFRAGDRPHRLVIAGAGNADANALAEDTAKIVATAARDFGPLPYDEYTFALFTTRDVQGGLEHRNSTVLAFPRFSFRDDKGRQDLLSLIAHEHFHVWNVKRAKPREFARYDLRNETYTRALWVCEGVTSYYDELIVLRSGLVTRDVWLARLSDELTRYLESPGRLEQSLADASLTAWTRFYRQDEDFPNSGVSYYQKGALVALLLDLEIRFATDSARSLDDVMRELFARHPAGSSGFTLEEFEGIAREVADTDLAPFFAAAIHSSVELDFAAALDRFGLRIDREERQPAPTVRDWIGVRIKPGAIPLRVDTVERGSAAERSGVAAGDEIVALDGQRVAATTLAERLKEARGRSAAIALFRDDELIERRVAVPAAPFRVAKVVVSPAGTTESRARLEAWLGPIQLAGPAEAAR